MSPETRVDLTDTQSKTRDRRSRQRYRGSTPRDFDHTSRTILALPLKPSPCHQLVPSHRAARTEVVPSKLFHGSLSLAPGKQSSKEETPVERGSLLLSNFSRRASARHRFGRTGAARVLQHLQPDTAMSCGLLESPIVSVTVSFEHASEILRKGNSHDGSR